MIVCIVLLLCFQCILGFSFTVPHLSTKFLLKSSAKEMKITRELENYKTMERKVHRLMSMSTNMAKQKQMKTAPSKITIFENKKDENKKVKKEVAKASKEDLERAEKLKKELEKNWRLLLHDDDIHTIDFVDSMLKQVPTCAERSHQITMQVHNEGSAVVCIDNKSLVEEYMNILGSTGLVVSMLPDDEFEDGGGGEKL